ncbi:MAG: 2-oxo-4-hydroxy-4-carboxy-5-ureidoimidazoline decarboxylase [Sandaracinaceae bacterium]|nr:2-oxo-4-hydroxy-4-carboxy-5-ureidoimidazoline decarboxylase [Sandaracinaceae bacterium]
MSDPAAALDGLSESAARAALARCCGATRWVEGMLARRPFRTLQDLLRTADEVWAAMERADVLEAFTHHPRIGADLAGLRAKYAATADWSAGEQAGAAGADEATLIALRDGNLAYEARYGHIFIVCATGKSAAQMLEILRSRMNNDPQKELSIAAAEQAKITKLRLEKLRLEEPA